MLDKNYIRIAKGMLGEYYDMAPCELQKVQALRHCFQSLLKSNCIHSGLLKAIGVQKDKSTTAQESHVTGDQVTGTPVSNIYSFIINLYSVLY